MGVHVSCPQSSLAATGEVLCRTNLGHCFTILGLHWVSGSIYTGGKGRAEGSFFLSKCLSLPGAPLGQGAHAEIHLKRGVEPGRELALHQIFQGWNLLNFTKWLCHGTPKGTYELAALTKNIRTLCRTLMHHKDSREPAQPAVTATSQHGNLVKTVGSFLRQWYDFLEPLQSGANGQQLLTFQGALVIGLQVLIPPIRGKPFWNLHLDQGIGKSMYTSCSLSHQPFVRLSSDLPVW